MKAAAVAQKAAAVLQARTQQQEYVGWWAKCEDCGRWCVTHSIDWAERDFHGGDNKRLCSQPADIMTRYPDQYLLFREEYYMHQMMQLYYFNGVFIVFESNYASGFIFHIFSIFFIFFTYFGYSVLDFYHKLIKRLQNIL